MKYSDIVGSGFYNIKLSQKMSEFLDVYFSGASHHLFRCLEAEVKNDAFVDFHMKIHESHLRHLMNIVYKYGDFSCSKDLSLREMDKRESWNPDKYPLPDPNMFDSMFPDARYSIGEYHLLCDRYLKNLIMPTKKANKSAPTLKITYVS